MKYCPYCGAGLDQDMRFCPSCGKPFEGGKENPHLTGNEQKTEAVAPTPAPAPAGAEPVAPAPKKKRGGLIALIAVVVVLAILGALFASGAFSPKEEPIVPFSDDPEAIAAASESVVMLTCYDKEGEPYATGSGFAVFDDGVIVTNYHVIQDKVYRVSAQTESGRSFDCPTVLTYDAERDIAILKADRETGLALLPTGDSGSLQKGEKVVAVGSPLGLINSVSTGVFSGYIDDEFGKMLQFTAAISHGSSGGALFNNAGEVIGITFASLSEGQSLNLGVPINEVKALYDYAGSQKPMSMEAFYDTFDHTPPIPTYTVGYVLEHYEELDGQEFYLEGYLSALNIGEFVGTGTATRIYLVESIDDVVDTKVVFDDSSYSGAVGIRVASACVEGFKCLLLEYDGETLDWLNPKDKLKIHCQLNILGDHVDGKKVWGGYKLSFLCIDYPVVE